MQNPFSAIQGVSSLNQASQMNSLNAPSSVGSVGSISPSLPSISAPSESDAKSFSNLLGDALGSVNSTMQASQTATNNLLNGRLENLHDLTIAGAKSEVMLRLTTQIASKLCSSATTLFQMQL